MKTNRMPKWVAFFWRPKVRIVLSILIGAGLGFLYWYKIGCATGGCPITSDPWLTTVFGALMGASIGWPSPDQNKSSAPEADKTKSSGSSAKSDVG